MSMPRSTPPLMALATAATLLLLGAAPPLVAQKLETRCGWLVNPTPGNFELVDRDGRWLLSSQSGYQVPGMDEIPDMTVAGWVATNGSYGHGCACLKVVTSGHAQAITRLVASTPIPLARCRKDRRLPPP